MLLTVKIPQYIPPPYAWRFNAKALLDSTYTETIGQAIADYFELNQTSTDDASLLWEAFKATIRGVCISTNAGILKDIRTQLSKREAELSALEQEYERTYNIGTLSKIRTVLSEYQEFAVDELKYMSRRQTARTYGEGGRPGRVLVQKICSGHKPQSVILIHDDKDTPRHDPQGILSAFMNSYSNLYKSCPTPAQSETMTYLEDVAIAWLSDMHREYLSQPITVEEVTEVVKSLPNGNVPGPCGFTSEFYKAYIGQLAPHIVAMYGDAYDKQILPPSLREALLIALLKPNKDAAKCESYRPLSLINTDTKILAKVLAKRLQLLMPFIILPDQSGFIPGRSTAHNTCTLFALSHYLTPDTQAAAVLLDAAKAFDSIEWSYLLAILQKMGFPPIFIQWIRVLHAQPTACIKVNKYISEPISIERGTRQGCPLSPLLFAIALEPLACKIRQNYKYAALQFPQRPLNISLYSDDMVLYIPSHESLPHASGIYQIWPPLRPSN